MTDGASSLPDSDVEISADVTAGPGENDDPAYEEGSRFAGDEGTWEPRLRDAVVHLYKRRFISKAQHPQHWDPLLQNLPVVRADLNNHNLSLVVDTMREVMFKTQAPLEDDGPTLLRNVSYTLEETALLVALRSLAFETADRLARIDHADLVATLSEYRPAHVADEKAKSDKEARAIKKMLDIGILRPDDSDDTYVVDPIIEAMLPYTTLVALHDVLHDAPDLNTAAEDSDEDGLQ